jgi:dethiobiotin synthetase/adenosylmethionine--8-amino-7-oxononanoate aminotransferase
MVYRQHGSSSSSESSSSSSSSSDSSSSGNPVLSHLHDAASSWWTQTAASSQLQLEVARSVAAAAGRYMHVMWPQVSPQLCLMFSSACLLMVVRHQSAVQLCELLWVRCA